MPSTESVRQLIFQFTMETFSLLGAVVLLSCFASSHQADIEEENDVLILTAKNFNEAISAHEHILVMFCMIALYCRLSIFAGFPDPYHSLLCCLRCSMVRPLYSPYPGLRRGG